MIAVIPDGLVLDISEPAQYQEWEYERWLLDFDATTEKYFPEGDDSGVGCLYLLGLSDGWIKAGRTTRWWTERRTTLRRQMRQRHDLVVEREWKTPSLPATDLEQHESRVMDYARHLADGKSLTYERGGALSQETEMFHGVDFGRIRAYADVIGRCAALW